MKRWPKIGTRVHVEWMDCCGYVNAPLSAAVPLPCWSEGILVRKSQDYIVLASSQYRGEGDDPTGDYTAIPAVWITDLKRL
jgi:hypothetical protein